MKKLKQIVMNNLGMKILSFGIAVLVWLLVANINDPVVSKRFSDIKVEVINDEKLTDQGYAYEILEGDAVTITVRGKNSIVSTLTSGDFQAVADFSKLSKVDAVPIDVSVKRYGDQLELSLGNVNTVKIREEKTTSISVPVNVEVKGDAVDGYAIGKAVGKPNLVRVTGPESLLKNAKEIRAEVKVDNVARDVTTTVPPVLYDRDGEEISSNQIEMDTKQIEVVVEVWKKKAVKVRLGTAGEPEPGYRLVGFDYEPKKVTVAAPDAVLAELDSIDLGEIDLDGYTENYEADLDINEMILQEDVKVVDETTVIKVKATIEKIVSRTMGFNKEDIRIMGNDKREVSFDGSNKYSMTIEGTSTQVQSVKIADFEPWIDLEGLEEGEHEVSVHVKEIEGISVEKTPEIKVTLGE